MVIWRVESLVPAYCAAVTSEFVCESQGLHFESLDRDRKRQEGANNQ